MDGFYNSLDSIIAASNAHNQAAEGDYIGTDGLLYCGKCHTRKQTEIKFLGMIRRPMCLCKCEQEKREQEAAALKKREFAEQVKRFRRLGFPESDMQTWTFANDDGKNEKLTAVIRRYVDHFDKMEKGGKGLLLYGGVGTGKTYAACEAANALIDQGVSALVTNFSRIANTLQGMFNGRQEYLDSLNDFRLLVLDDLGIERNSAYMQEIVYSIIDGRYRANLPMIITTNTPIEQIKNPESVERARIYDRILERCFPVEVSGGSKRRQIVRADFADMRDMLGL